MIPSITQINEFIESEINPGLNTHGGFLSIIKYDELTGDLNVSMGGGCHGCASSTVTLKLMITQLLKEEFPSLGNITDFTDH